MTVPLFEASLPSTLGGVGRDHLVSIVTPAYKAATYIGQTIESVRSQTHPDWEMLIADDCSPDDTRAVVREWCGRDPRIRLLPMEKNSGPAAARNTALRAAQGRWIAFLDSDDLWLPRKLELSIAHAIAHDAPLVFTGFRRTSFDGQAIGRYISVPRRISYRQLLGNTAIATSTVLVDRQKTGDIQMQSVYYDDYVCWLGILKKGFSAFGLNEDLMRYRVMPQSVSRNKKKSAQHVWRTYRDVERLGLLPACWYFAQYAARGYFKYRRF